MYDVIIKNGTIIDGTGAKTYEGDVAVKNGRIAAIGELHDERAETEIDAQGKYVCPGFIDVNNHSDSYWQIFLEPELDSLIYQGITTIVCGNCGSSLAPLTSAKNLETIQKWVDFKLINLNWLQMTDFLKAVEQRKLPVNFSTLVGHATLRRGVLQDQSRHLVYNELKFINSMLEKAMKDGAFGLSSGLIYSHARTAPLEELVGLAKIVKKYGGVYATHVRGEKEELISAIQEAIEIGDKSGAKLHISHLKAMGRKNWKKMDEALRLIDEAEKFGVDISFDVYPYTNTGSVLYALLPAWVAEGGKRMMIHRLKDLEIRKKVIEEMKKTGFDYDRVEIAISPLNRTLARKKITEIAKSQEKSVEDAIIDILIASEGRVITSMEVLSEKNIEKALKHPRSIVASNGAGYKIEHAQTGEVIHPRSFGSFMRILAHYVQKKKLLSLEEAIRKMTGFPAERFGIKERGVIAKENYADLLVIDPVKMDSPASKENPYQYAKGIDWMLVNGKVVIKNGEYNKGRSGQVIRLQS